MTCKDCIGYKFCSRGRNGQTNFYGKDVACNNVDILCNDFKNKADFVEVVRCRKCKHGDVATISKSKDGEETIACYCKLKGRVTDVDSYCPCGERRDAE
jgi:hypothetical protein